MGLQLIIVGLVLAELNCVRSLDDITNNLSELSGSHGDSLVRVTRLGARIFLVGEHADIVSEFASSAQIVTRDEMKGYSRIM